MAAAVKTPESQVLGGPVKSSGTRIAEGLRSGRVSLARSLLERYRAPIRQALEFGRAAARFGCRWGEVR
jgi:hypothetical protein